LILRLEKTFRVGLKTVAAARGAKQIFRALIVEAMFGGRTLDLHAADRIDRDLRVLVGFPFMIAAAAGSGSLIMIGVTRVTVMIVVVLTVVVMMAGVIAGGGVFGAVSMFAVGHFSLPSLLNNIP
jgi:hypothetical protein